MNHDKLNPINIVFYSKYDSFDAWKLKLLKFNIILHKWPENYDNNSIYNEIEGALVWDPPSDMWSCFPNLKIIQSLGAGVDHILNKVYPKNINIIKLSDPDLSNQMAEYLLMSVLMCYRRYFQYSNNKQNKIWKPLTPLEKNSFIITILGYGAISKLLIKKLNYMGFTVKVWGNKKRNPNNIDYYYGNARFHNSLKNTSCLISLLPSTLATHNLLGLSEFKLLSKDCYFINAGRGLTVIEEELIYALKNKILNGAILDVFMEEPLDKGNLLWDLDNVYITPHIAGITQATNYASKLLRNNLELLYKKKRLINKVSIIKGY